MPREPARRALTWPTKPLFQMPPTMTCFSSSCVGAVSVQAASKQPLVMLLLLAQQISLLHVFWVRPSLINCLENSAVFQ